MHNDISKTGSGGSLDLQGKAAEPADRKGRQKLNRPFNYVISDEFVINVSNMARGIEKVGPGSQSQAGAKSLAERKYRAMLRLDGISAQETGEEEYTRRLDHLREAMGFAMKADLYSTDDYLAMHGILFEGVMEDCGIFRDSNAAREGSPSGRALPSASTIPQFMKDLFEWLEKAKVHPVIKAAVFVLKCVGTLPFAEGNALAANVWADALLSRTFSPVFSYLPQEEAWIDSEKVYAARIRDSFHYSDCGAYLDFWADRILTSLNGYLGNLASDPARSGISDSVRRLIGVMDDKAYSTKELMAMTGLRHRQTFRDNYLLPAIRLGLIRMTVPDKPNSRNQKYLKTTGRTTGEKEQ